MFRKLVVISIIFLMIASGFTVISLSNTSSVDNAKYNYKYLTTTNTSRSGLAWNVNASPQLAILKQKPQLVGQGFPYNVSQIRQAYNLTGFYQNDTCGQGFTIAIVDAFGDPSLNYDLESFNSLYNLPTANISYYYPYGSPKNLNSSWSLETATDVEWFHAIAPRAHIDLIIVPNAEVGYLQGGVNDTINNISNVNGLSMSWGIAESSLSNGLMYTYNQAFLEANKKDIHIFAASGDQGAYDATKALTVNFPAGDPYVTSVGGTTLNYADGKYTQTSWSGSGGGYSTAFSAPNYQNATGFHGQSLGVPDISAVANPNDGGVTVFSRGNAITLGGTSLATPITAGSFILIDQALHGKLGFINPLLFNLSRTNQYGKAIIPAVGGSNGYYTATYGWNPVTGLGSINAGLFAKDISQIYSYYGYSVTYGQINTSYVNFNTEVSMSPLTSASSQYISFAGLTIGSYGSTIRAGLCQIGNSIYESFKAGNYIYLRNLGTEKILSKKVVVQLKVDKLTITVGNTTKDLQVFPQSIYGTNASFIFEFSSGEGKPLNSGTASSSENVFNNGYLSVTQPVSGKPIYPFNKTACSTLQIKNTSNSIEFSYNSSNPSGSFEKNSGAYPSIELNQSSPMFIYISNTGGNTVTLNGKIENSRTIQVNSGESLKIRFYRQLKMTFQFDIDLPSVSSLHLHFSYPADSNYSNNFTSIIDYTSNLRLNDTTGFSSLGSCTNLTTNSMGFRTNTSHFANSDTKVREQEIPVNLSFDISPIGAKLSLSNGSEILDHNGIIVYSVIPQFINFTIKSTKNGYKNTSGFLRLKPGFNVTYLPFSLGGNGNGYYLNGTVANGYYDAEYSITIPIASAKISYSDINASSDRFGYFSIWLPTGKDQVTTDARYFYSTKTNYTLEQNKVDQLILLQPNISSLLESALSITIDRLIPLFFFTSFISWSISFSSSTVSYYIVEYRTSGQLSWNKVRMSGHSNNIAFINGIYPDSKYYFKVIAVLDGGATVNSNVRTISYKSPIYLFLNILIYMGIMFYIYAMISYFRGRRRRKKLKDSFRDW